MSAFDVHRIHGLEAETELAAFFEACPDSYAQQTPGWRRVIAALGDDEPLFLAARWRQGTHAGELAGVLPAYRFSGPLGAILTSCCQAGPLGGVACHPEAPRAAIYEEVLAAFAAAAADTGCVLATVITNPMWPDRELYDGAFDADYVLDNRCLVLDLDRDVDAEGGYPASSTSLRRNLRKARSGVLEIEEDQTRDNVDEWYRIHSTRHRAIGAVPLPQELFAAALQHMVPRDKARFFFVRLRDSGEMVAGGFYVYHGAVIDALMPSMSSEHAGLRANFLLADHSIRWARERGLRYYNWQPSPPASGVYRYKKQWGSRDVGYQYLTKVTGDAGAFLASTPDVVASAYRWHYALPFDRLGTDAGSRPSSRQEAWEAEERFRETVTPRSPDS